MILLSLVTSIKDYVEVLHKLVETNSTNGITSYYDLGATITFFTLTFKETFFDFLSFKWIQDVWSIPIIIPDLSSSMISEVSIFNGIFENTFHFLDKPLSYGNHNFFLYCLEKFVIGLLNSLFLCLATSTSSLITLRRFVMQGLEAGYIAGLGSIAGNIVWIASIIFGFRFIVIPWLSLDIFRYILGFILLVKYMWDSYSERRSILTNLSKTKMFTLNFLLAFTEQTNIFPFLNNLSLSSDSTILETFPTLTNNSFEFFLIHGSYLFGLLLGSLSLLQFTCWFWENPAYNFYMWTISSFKVTTSFYSKLLNFVFLYLTMICTINSIGYFGLDYTLTNPLGFVHEDRLIEQKMLLETSFLNSKASDRNTRRNRGRHGRRERWKRRVRLYRTFDASLYDQGVYDLFTIEDLNYGFDRFWLRRKIRNHRVRFRFFPGPWMRSLKKQFARPRLESFMGPRIEFFRILFEQAYHPEFHEFKSIQKISPKIEKTSSVSSLKKNNYSNKFMENTDFSLYSLSQIRTSYNKKDYYSNIGSNSFLRKFLRKVDNRMKFNQSIKKEGSWIEFFNEKQNNNISSSHFSLIQKNSFIEQNLFEKFYKNLFNTRSASSGSKTKNNNFLTQNIPKKWSKSDKFLTEYKNLLSAQSAPTKTISNTSPLTLFHPLKFYIQKDDAFRKKCRFYGVKQYRSYNVENNAPYFRVMMKRFFYYYKPTLRWERTMRVATMRKARRKNARIARIPQGGNSGNSEIFRSSNLTYNSAFLSNDSNRLIESLNGKADLQKTLKIDSKFSNEKTMAFSLMQKPTHFYSLVSKKASRYRYQIYKDVLQHWYYSKMNRLLLKFDVDSFIRRQPKIHFLTKNEETSLHMKRYLLFEYYNSLRWYNFMQHYNTMKTSIGKTKSLANRAYNQQFYGTFKKIRHLFAITPSFNQSVLKFDQPLYNEFPNSFAKNEIGGFSGEASKFIKSGIVSDSFIHEELKSIPESIVENKLFNYVSSEIPKDIISNAKMAIQHSLKERTIFREKTIESFLIKKDYMNLTKFFLNENSKQERNPFLESLNNEPSLYKEANSNIKTNNEQMALTQNFTKNIWFHLLKKSQNKLYDQKALKNFVLSKVEKHEKKIQKKEKNLIYNIEKLKTWYQNADSVFLEQKLSLSNNSEFSSTIQKAMKEAVNSANYLGGETPIKNKKRFLSYKHLCTELDMENCMKNFSNTEMVLSNTKENLKRKSLKALKGNILKNISFSDFSKTFFKTFFKNPMKKIFSETFALNKKLLSSKNVNNWREGEKVLSKRKKIRKTFKRLKNNQNFSLNARSAQQENFQKNKFLASYSLLSSEHENAFKSNKIETRKKLDTLNNETNMEKFEKWILEKKKRNWYTYHKKEKDFSIEWKKRRSRIRRYRFFKGRGPIKKRTLGEKLKSKFRFLKKYGLMKESLATELQGSKTEGLNKEVSDDSKNLLKSIILDKNVMKSYNAIFETLSQNSSNLSKNETFEMRPMKQSRTLVKKHRYWKKHKKPIFAQNKRKLRKRRRYLKAKIRVLTKKWKNIEFQLFMKKWWWQQFVPNFNEKNTKTENFILNSNYFENTKINPNSQNFKEALEKQSFSQKNKTFLKDSLMEQTNKSLIETMTIKPSSAEKSPILDSNIQLNSSEKNNAESFTNAHPSNHFSKIKTSTNNIVFGLNEVIKNVYSKPQNIQTIEEYSKIQTTRENTNNTPFYAGWDENLRKFVVTNRLLSRKNAGYFISPDSTIFPSKKTLDQTGDISKFQSFLTSMNAATTLYWQIPFTTYDPDQFFALGMDGFSPIGWKNFTFQFSQRTTKPILVKKMTTLPYSSLSKNNPNFKDSKNQSAKAPSLSSQDLSAQEMLKGKIFETEFSVQPFASSLSKGYERFTYNYGENKERNISLNNQRFNQINQYRRIQKRYKRVKKHPRPPVWFPSGPLSSQILPVHYIYVFYKRYRLPRDRYVRRRLRSVPTESFNSIKKNLVTNAKQTSSKSDQGSSKLSTSFSQTNFSDKSSKKNRNIYNYTLRKRVKPKRKYHRKIFTFSRKNENMVDTILRRPFRGFVNEQTLFRPSTSFILSKNEGFGAQSARKDKIKSRKKSENKSKLSNKSSRENLRLRQLRRRVQRQVFRPVWRYKPQAGGFIWPGDYLRLDSIKSAKLHSKNSNLNNVSSAERTQKNARKIRKKKRRIIPEWQIQPKKYLIQKHNVKVFKKRLEKSQKKL